MILKRYNYVTLFLVFTIFIYVSYIQSPYTHLLETRYFSRQQQYPRQSEQVGVVPVTSLASFLTPLTPPRRTDDSGADQIEIPHHTPAPTNVMWTGNTVPTTTTYESIIPTQTDTHLQTFRLSRFSFTLCKNELTTRLTNSFPPTVLLYKIVYSLSS